MEWAATNTYRYPVLELLFAIPNGGKRAKKTAKDLKNEGVKRGIPDLMLPVPVCRLGWDYLGQFIEMKRRGGAKPTPEQLAMHLKLRAQGYEVIVCNGWIEAAREIINYLGFDRRESGLWD